eukprot:5032944-Prymnesium_polylepis.1
MGKAVNDADVAFYFVHWLTDLAGAEPTPLEGSEKFVLKFPMPVLAAFIKSFAVINELAHKTETQASNPNMAPTLIWHPPYTSSPKRRRPRRATHGAAAAAPSLFAVGPALSPAPLGVTP